MWYYIGGTVFMIVFAKQTIMKTRTTLQFLLIASLLATAACNNEQTAKTENMADTVAARVDTMAKNVKQDAQNVANEVKDDLSGNVDSNFVVKASVANMTELKVLQAAWDNGTSKELKAHAKMMIADHKKLGTGMKAYATKKGYVIPDNDKSDDVLNNINKSSKGNDWDKAWVDHMVSAHEDAISLFEKGQNNVKDAELKTMITNALPTLHAHLDMMKQLQDKMGK